MKINKVNQLILLVFYLLVIIVIGLWIAKSDIFIRDKISSRAKKVFVPAKISRFYYEQ